MPYTILKIILTIIKKFLVLKIVVFNNNLGINDIL